MPPSRAKILLVDDEPFNTDVLSMALAKYEIRVASDGGAALRLAAEFEPDLILLDIGLPDIDGYEVCQQLKQDPELKNIQIIFLTGMTGQAVVTSCFKAGAVDYIAKPFGIAEVQARVQTHLGLKLAHDTLNSQNTRLEATVREQELNIGLARQLLRLVNGDAPRHVPLNHAARLYVQTMVWPCHQEGGDHLQVKVMAERTVLSLKDQSGHSVGCVLRSIATDLLHNALWQQHRHLPLGARVGRLNEELCRSGFFHGDEFCTALLAELDHRTLALEVVAAGHPPLLLIRDGQVLTVPERGSGSHSLPLAFMEDAVFGSVTCQLRVGDRLLIFSDGLHQFGGTGEALRPQELVDLVSQLVAEEPQVELARLLPLLLRRLDHDFACADLVERNPSADDLSLIGLEIEPAPQPQEMRLKPADFPSIDHLIDSVFARLWPEMVAARLCCTEEGARLAVSESILNAWKHGHRRDAGKDILIAWELGNDFCLSITDQGRGFDPRQLHDPTNGFRLTEDHGRGLFMVRRVVDWLEWRREGRQIVLSWRRDDTLPPDASGSGTLRLGPVCDLWGSAADPAGKRSKGGRRVSGSRQDQR